MGFPAEASRSLSSKDLEPGIQAPSSLAPYLWAALDSSRFCGGVCLDNLHTTVVILSPWATRNKPNFPVHPSLVRTEVRENGYHLKGLGCTFSHCTAYCYRHPRALRPGLGSPTKLISRSGGPDQLYPHSAWGVLQNPYPPSSGPSAESGNTGMNESQISLGFPPGRQ